MRSPTKSKDLDLLACLQTIGQIKGPAFSIECKADVRNNATASHWIKYKVTLLGEVKEGMGDQLGRNLPEPARSPRRKLYEPEALRIVPQWDLQFALLISREKTTPSHQPRKALIPPRITNGATL